MAPCSQWAKTLFKQEPIVISVPGVGGSFARKGLQWAATGDTFRAAINELAPQYKNTPIRRKAIVAFSVGWQFPHQVLMQSHEMNTLDALFLQDGLTTPLFNHWVEYATRAIKNETLMVLAHNHNATFPSLSPKETNSTILQQAKLGCPLATQTSLPDYLRDPQVPQEGLRVTVSPARNSEGRAILPGLTKVWSEDCLSEWEAFGQLYRLEYTGIERQDSAYIARHVGPRLWRMLADRWA